jgi:hypothetical protein
VLLALPGFPVGLAGVEDVARFSWACLKKGAPARCCAGAQELIAVFAFGDNRAGADVDLFPCRLNSAISHVYAQITREAP